MTSKKVALLRRRLIAGAYRVLHRNYGRVRRFYWELRARDVERLYGGTEADFGVIRSLLHRYKPQSVLDLGCGAGRLFPLYIEAGVPRVFGVDISARALALARRKYPTVRTLRASAEELPLHERYEMVIATRVFQHIPPDHIGAAIKRATQAASRLVYVNEIGEKEGSNPSAGSGQALAGAGYIFLHDYTALFARHGWECAERGPIPDTGQTYMLFSI